MESVEAARPRHFDQRARLAENPMSKMTMTIGGMTCGHCVSAVNGALKNLEGVEVERVTIGKATLSYDDARVSPTDITQAVEEEGYTVLKAE
jgi:copper chaperone